MTGGAGTTVGVEEEFLILSAESGRPVPRAPDVLAALGSDGSAAGPFKPELHRSQIEAVTPVLTTMTEVAGSLLANRAALDGAARGLGLRAVGVGTPVLRGGLPQLSGGDRYRAFARTYRGVIADYETCGCHVHVGVPDADHAAAVVDHLRPWLPTLLALSANSRFHHGRDTGHASWRMVEQARLPGGGIPPRFGDHAGHRRHVDRLVDCGVLVDARTTFWLARPSPRYPTVEVRAADVSPSLHGALLQAGLVRGLVRTALADLDLGRTAADLDGHTAAAALWSAARYGIHGTGVDPVAGRRVPATDLLGDLLRRIRPALEDTGDLDTVERLLDRVVTGRHDPHRHASADRLHALVDDLAGRLAVPYRSLGPRARI